MTLEMAENGTDGPESSGEGLAGIPGSPEAPGAVDGFTSKVARGSASELLACAHFLRLGYHVFRAMASTCPVDLVVQAPGGPLRGAEVKSGRRYPKAGMPVFTRPRNDDWELLVVVDEAGVVYVLEDASPGDTTAQMHSHWHKQLGLVGDV